MKHMSAPKFYNASKVGTLYKPDLNAVTKDGEAAGLRSANSDKEKNALLLVDFQVDFCHTDGSLSVPGSVDDLRRTCEFIFNNAERISTVAASLDTHLQYQIFYSTWWVDSNGNHPSPHTVITADDIRKGKYRPVQDPAWSVKYVEQLEAQAQKPLYIWPFHTMLGNVGQALDPALYEAIHWHSIARKAQPVFMQKGMIPQTEHYSPFEPEVKIATHPNGGLNTQLLQLLQNHDRIFVAGEAKSHCVLEACRSMVKHFSGNPDVIKRIHFLSDCTSSVVAPGIDFEAIATAELAKFAQAGMQFTTSTASF